MCPCFLKICYAFSLRAQLFDYERTTFKPSHTGEKEVKGIFKLSHLNSAGVDLTHSFRDPAYPEDDKNKQKRARPMWTQRTGSHPIPGKVRTNSYAILFIRTNSAWI